MPPEDETDNPGLAIPGINQEIYRLMQEFYFWEDELPVVTDFGRINDNDAFLRSLRFEPLDRWSYVTTREAFEAAFTGQASGVHGFGFQLQEQSSGDFKMFLAFVFENGPAGQDGWQRGWEVTHINGRPIMSYRTGNGFDFQLGPNVIGSTNTFTFRLPDGTETTRTIRRDAFQTNSVLHQEAFQLAGKKVGYWVYHSFRATAGENPVRSLEVENSFQFFNQEQVQELIIDLRYNGGGSVAVTEQILNYLIPQAANNQVMYTIQHNRFQQNARNRTVNFRRTGNLQLQRVIFLTSRSSASASELLINCLEPYMEVVLIGDNTFGKPVGSFTLSNFSRPLQQRGLELVPITFATTNATGVAEYFDGLPADFFVADDPTRNWGDRQEARFQAALQLISSGSIQAGARSSYRPPFWEMIDHFSGLEQEFLHF